MSGYGARRISSADQIPSPDARWTSRLVELVRMDIIEDAVRTASAVGAEHGPKGWTIRRNDPFPFDELAGMLPRMAQRTLVPEVVDLIPASSWFASLANMLVASSWSQLRDPAILRQGGCQECGMRGGTEGHEMWSYDASAGRQSLVGIRALCFQCHEMQHLGRANVNGRFDRVFDRLCRLNRIRPDERAGYRARIFDLWQDRSRREWDLDLSVRGDDMLVLKSSILYAGDNWIVQPGTTQRREVASRIVNAEVLSDGRRLVIVPIGTSAAL